MTTMHLAEGDHAWEGAMVQMVNCFNEIYRVEAWVRDVEHDIAWKAYGHETLPYRGNINYHTEQAYRTLKEKFDVERNTVVYRRVNRCEDVNAWEKWEKHKYPDGTPYQIPNLTMGEG